MLRLLAPLVLAAPLTLYSLGGGSPRTAPTKIACIGDSITQSIAASISYPTRLASYTGKRVENLGFGGYTTTTIAPKMTLLYSKHVMSHAVIEIGVNDIRTPDTAANTWARLQPLYDQVLNDGAYLVAVNICPFKNTAGWTTGMQTEAVALNADIQSYVTANASRGVVLADCYSALGGFGGNDVDALDPSYDSGDHLHPNQAGTDKLAQTVHTALQTQGVP